MVLELISACEWIFTIWTVESSLMQHAAVVCREKHVKHRVPYRQNMYRHCEKCLSTGLNGKTDCPEYWTNFNFFTFLLKRLYKGLRKSTQKFFFTVFQQSWTVNKCSNLPSEADSDKDLFTSEEDWDTVEERSEATSSPSSNWQLLKK